MQAAIDTFIKAKTVAVVGVSKRKFGGTICKELSRRGYRVCPVNPKLSEFDGTRCYPSLSALPEGVEAAVVAISRDHATGIIGDAESAGISSLWFQQGVDFVDVAREAESKGMNAVHGKCILMYAPPVGGIHAFHRWIARLFHRL